MSNFEKLINFFIITNDRSIKEMQKRGERWVKNLEKKTNV